MKRCLVFSAALLLVTSMAVAQNNQDPYRSKPQRSDIPKSKSVRAAPHRKVSTPPPVTSGTGKGSSTNQQLSKLEHATNKTVNSPHKTASGSAALATKPAQGASAKRPMNFSYQPPKAAPASGHPSQGTKSAGVRGRVVGTGK